MSSEEWALTEEASVKIGLKLVEMWFIGVDQSQILSFIIELDDIGLGTSTMERQPQIAPEMNVGL